MGKLKNQIMKKKLIKEIVLGNYEVHEWIVNESLKGAKDFIS